MTAETIYKHNIHNLATALHIDERLREQHLGALENQPWTPETIRNRQQKDGESLDDVAERAKDILIELWDKHLKSNSENAQNIAIVSHGIWLNEFINLCCKEASPSLPLRSNKFTNTGITTIQLARLNSINNNHCNGDVEINNDNLSEDAEKDGKLGFYMRIIRENHNAHLKGMIRQRGIGSAAFDERQTQLKFFNKSSMIRENRIEGKLVGKISKTIVVRGTEINPLILY
ncbi:2845_t:CDS:1 [Ambispora gerdemannii]|uniref:2845_t:CDS:1 n=1 Tax=Ambispora gerdemannii TaxID=144530 RepID=A0A9N8ZWE1_9GLOM|nr:2845_t:CDS:1 [Ambispora gerdemannii]